MSGLKESIMNNYNYIVHELADPRTQNYLAVSNPFVILTIISAYLYFCKSLGPRLMKDRPAFELRNVLLVYNLCQVFLSIYLVYIGTLIITHKEYSLACEPIDYGTSPRAMAMASACWWYYFAKLTELLDTVFFVLRKKYNQVSFLHVYHHTIMASMVWFGVKYVAGGHVIIMGYLNSWVHIFMYTYYFIAGLGPEYQKYIWWKKHVTLIQLIQFVFILFHNSVVFFYECGYPRLLNVLLGLNALAFINMFGRFYIRNYQKESKKSIPNTKKASLLVDNIKNPDVRQRRVEKSR